jgi:hypothetical protein
VRYGVISWKVSNVCRSLDGWLKNYYLELLRASEGTLSRESRLHFQSLAPTNPHWARVVGYAPFSLCVIHKKGLCPSSGNINRVMMMTSKLYYIKSRSVHQYRQIVSAYLSLQNHTLPSTTKFIISYQLFSEYSFIIG